MGYMDPSQGVSRGYPGGCRWILRSLDSKMAILGSFWTPPRMAHFGQKGSEVVKPLLKWLKNGPFLAVFTENTENTRKMGSFLTCF